MILPHRHQMDGAFAARLRPGRHEDAPAHRADVRSDPLGLVGPVRARPRARRAHVRRRLRHLRLLDHARRRHRRRARDPPRARPAAGAGADRARQRRLPLARRGGAPQPDDPARQRRCGRIRRRAWSRRPTRSSSSVQSAGPAPVTVPDVVGLALPYAEKVVVAAGIRVGRVDTVRGGGTRARHRDRHPARRRAMGARGARGGPGGERPPPAVGL